jgi:cytochrome c-type biogenesis protein CcmH
MKMRRHCEEPTGRRSNLDPPSANGLRLLPPGTARKRRPSGGRNDVIGFVVFFMLSLLLANPAYAVRPDEMLPDPALEARARAVGEELRCLVCRNQSIEESEADLAHDLRMLVRQRIAAGDSDAQIVAFVRSRYGDFVLLRPPLNIGTLLLWGGPALILLLGGIAVARFYYGRHIEPAPPPLSAEERLRLAAVLSDSNKP